MTRHKRAFGYVQSILQSRVLSRKIVIIGLLIIISFLVIAIFSPWLVTFNIQQINVFNRLSPPNLTHLFGTDAIGRDIFSRVLYGTQYSIIIGLSVMVFAMLAGTVLGTVAGFFRHLDNLIMRIFDGMMAFPTILLAIAMMAALGSSAINVIIALSIVSTPRVARVVRSKVLVTRELTYIEAARSVGVPLRRIVLWHVLPNIVSPIIVQGTFIFAQAILSEAALSFLGIGVPPMTPTWGNILNEGRSLYQIAYWYMLAPGLFIVLSVFGVNMLGDGLRDIADPLTFERKR